MSWFKDMKWRDWKNEIRANPLIIILTLFNLHIYLMLKTLNKELLLLIESIR